MLVKIAFSIFLLAIGIISYRYGQSVPMKEQMPLFDGLRNTSAIIFGVMGAWLAILHPTSLKKIFGKEKSGITKEDRETISLLLSPILISTFILSVVLVVPLCVAAGKAEPSLVQYRELFRGLSFSLLGSLTIFQLLTLILTLIPGDILKKAIQKEEARENLREGMFSRTRKKKI